MQLGKWSVLYCGVIFRHLGYTHINQRTLNWRTGVKTIRVSQLQVKQKLPILYLIDSIVKNVGEEYKQLFQQEIVGIFVDVFDKVMTVIIQFTPLTLTKYVPLIVPQRQGPREDVCVARDVEGRVPADQTVHDRRQGEPARSELADCGQGHQEPKDTREPQLPEEGEESMLMLFIVIS